MAIFKYLLIAYVLFDNINGAIQAEKQYGEWAPKPPLYGIYTVKTFIKNNDTLAPLITDTARWKNLVISYQGYATVKHMNDVNEGFAFRPDTLKKQVVMFSYNDTANKSTLSYSLIGNDSMLLRGKFFGDSLLVTMKKYDLNNFLLISRGFHFINEYPLNK